MPSSSSPQKEPANKQLPGSADEVGAEDFAAYVAFLEGIPTENAIAKRFIGAAHMLARAVLVNSVFAFIRSLEFSWEETADMTADILNMSRSSVARAVSDTDRLVEFWNMHGYPVTRIEDIMKQVSNLTKERLADALEQKSREGNDS